LSNVLKILWIIAKRGGQINKVQNKGWTQCDFKEIFSIYALIVYNLEETWIIIWQFKLKNSLDYYCFYRFERWVKHINMSQWNYFIKEM
jgi:hypothetical protein